MRPLAPAQLAPALVLAVAASLVPGVGVAGVSSAASAVPAPDAVPRCRYGDVRTAGAGYEAWATTIVDTELRLPPGYEPPDLVSVGRAGLAGAGRVRSLLIDDLGAMAGAAADAGAPLAVISAYRSEAAQADVFAGWERQAGHAAALLASARPGHSEHELGTTIDFTTPDGTGPWANDFARSPQGRWLHAHAWRFGFVESYPAKGSPDLTCYQAEAWHYRYVGTALAAEVHASGLPLRAFLFRSLVRPGGAPDAGSPSGSPPSSSPGGGVQADGDRIPAVRLPGPTAPGAAAAPGTVAALASGLRDADLLPGLLLGLVLGRLGTLLRVTLRLVRWGPRTRGRPNRPGPAVRRPPSPR